MDIFHYWYISQSCVYDEIIFVFLKSLTQGFNFVLFVYYLMAHQPPWVI